MDANKKRKHKARRRRHQRLRKRVNGSAEIPRLNVYRSNDQIYAQLIDDRAGHTLVAASSLEDGVVTDDDGKVGQARQVGELVGQRAVAAGIDTVVFDRGGNRFAGRVKALAEAAADAGLNL